MKELPLTKLSVLFYLPAKVVQGDVTIQYD
jgi:hypothetical protein